MLKNYFKAALRNFSKDKIYSTITLSGLTIALATFLMITGYVLYEMSYDKYYSNSDRIYRIFSERTKNGSTEKSVLLPAPLASTLKKEFPEIESTTYLDKNDQEFIINNEPIKLKAITTDSNFFSIFNLPFIYGNATSSLINNNSIVIAEKIANIYFSKQNPVGLHLVQKKYDGSSEIFIVTGVIKDIPGNTHFNADIVISENLGKQELNWFQYFSSTEYILVNKNSSVSNLQKKISTIYNKYNFPKGTVIKFQPVTSIHLHSNIPDEPYANSSIKYVYIFSFIAFLILLIACINYINLSIARSLQRVKEVGVRKVLGAERKQIIFQFVTESVLFFCTTLPIALLLAYTLWPLFINVVNINVSENYLFNGNIIVIVLLVSFISGLLSGLYPAIFLSRLQPARILKDWQKSFFINMSIRKILIVFQFAVSVTLIISTIVVYQELNLLNNVELGFNKEQLIELPFQRFQKSTPVFKDELEKNSRIKAVTIASWDAGYRYGGTLNMRDPIDSTKERDFAFIDADLDFLKTMQIKIIEGRDFLQEFGAESFYRDSLLSNKSTKENARDKSTDHSLPKSIIITEQAAKMMHLKEPMSGNILKYGALNGRIIGIAKDFIGTSVLEKSPNVIIEPRADIDRGYTYIRISPQNINQTITYIHSVWTKFFPDKVFEFSFVDERLQNLYKSEQRLATISNVFSALAIILSALGLFSLVALVTRQKTKEIGIRKVLGASAFEIVQLLSKDFIRLICIAILIAVPIALWTMNAWLKDFSCRVTISAWIFILAGGGCILFAFIVVSIQALQAAFANPVKSLRTE